MIITAEATALLELVLDNSNVQYELMTPTIIVFEIDELSSDISDALQLTNDYTIED